MLSMLRLELPCMTAADSESKGHCCMRNRPWQELSISARGVLDEDGSPAVGVGPLMSCPISQVTLPHDCETPLPSPRPPSPPPTRSNFVHTFISQAPLPSRTPSAPHSQQVCLCIHMHASFKLCASRRLLAACTCVYLLAANSHFVKCSQQQLLSTV